MEEEDAVNDSREEIDSVLAKSIGRRIRINSENVKRDNQETNI